MHNYSRLLLFLLKAVKSRVTGPNFVWLFPEWFQLPWWNENNTKCSSEEMRSALDHSLEFADNSMLNMDASRMLVSNKVRLTLHGSLVYCMILTECVTVYRRSAE